MDFDTFIQACKDGDLTLVEQALPRMNVQQTDAQGNSPLIWAAYLGHLDVVKVLLPGSDLRHANKDGNTALILAAREKDIDMVNVLLSGSDLRQANEHGNTALLWATLHGDLNMVNALLPDSDLLQTTKKGMNAWTLAQREQHWPVVELLALHHPQREILEWPTEAKPDDLPQWFARIEQRALKEISQSCPVASNDQSKVRHRL